MKRAVYPGTFDPITFGHLDIIRRAADLFDELVIALMTNPSKKPLFSVTDRMNLVKTSLEDVPNARVDCFSGLLVDYVSSQDFQCVIRGIRNQADVQSEMQMAHMNASLAPSVQTVFLPTRPELSFISSSLVKEVAMYGRAVHSFVPVQVQEALKQQFSQPHSD